MCNLLLLLGFVAFCSIALWLNFYLVTRDNNKVIDQLILEWIHTTKHEPKKAEPLERRIMAYAGTLKEEEN